MTVSTPDELAAFFHPLFAGTGGIDSWLSGDEDDDLRKQIMRRLIQIPDEPLPLPQLNQLLILSHEAGMSLGFFAYYWCGIPDHTWDIASLRDFDESFDGADSIRSLNQLRWGFERFYVDALLYFGSIRTAYQRLRKLPLARIESFYDGKKFPTEYLKQRGSALPLEDIPQDQRYLIAEVACKTMEFGEDRDIVEEIVRRYREAADAGARPRTLKQLIEDLDIHEEPLNAQQMAFSFADSYTTQFETEDELRGLAQAQVERWRESREPALRNTRTYLSMIGDLDVYVATSMRTRADFRKMAKKSGEIFDHELLQDLHLRHFDPTLSAALGHEDKGLIECLMVRAAKTLVYFAGNKDSYGKDAEAAMALSQGKPVFFLCGDDQRAAIFQHIHPLSRLIEYDTGVAVGAIVIDENEIGVIVDLLRRTFTNTMRYEIEKDASGYLRLVESATKSVVRLQTSDQMLRETFWNYYHEVLGEGDNEAAGV